MSGYGFSVGISLALVVLILTLLRRRRLREKYAGVWITLGVVVVVLAVFPDLAFWLAHAVGVKTPANLVFALALTALFGLVIQLSAELSSLEDETRVLAEEVAIIGLELRELAPTVHTTQAAAEPTS